MSADRISTSGQIVLKSETFNNDLRSGASTVRVFTGSKADIIAQQHVEVGFGASMTKVESTGDGNYQLTASYAYDTSQGGQSTPPVNSHELENNMSQVDVWTNKGLWAAFLAAFGTPAAANSAIGYTKNAVRIFEDGDTQADIESQIDHVYTLPTYAVQNALMKNVFRGVALHQVKNCLQFDTVYRRRIMAASYNQVQAAFTGAEQIWTTAEVIAFENTPATWWFQLPAGAQWLKAKPVVVTVAQQKTEISYEYIETFAAWGILYTPYGAATLLEF